MRTNGIFGACMLTFCLYGFAAGQVKGIDDLSARIMPHSNVTYLDAVRLLFKNPLVENRTVSAAETIPITRQFQELDSLYYPTTVSPSHGPACLTGTFEVSGVDALELRDPSGFRLILGIGLQTDDSANLGGGAYVVGAFQPGAQVKLLDALEVKTANDSSLRGRFPISPTQDALSVSNEYSNSSGSYEIISTYFVFGGKLRPALWWSVRRNGPKRRLPSEILVLASAAPEEDPKSGCEVELYQAARFFVPVSLKEARFGAGIRIHEEKTREDCKTPAHRHRTYTLVWSWDRSVKKLLLTSGSPAWLKAESIKIGR